MRFNFQRLIVVLSLALATGTFAKAQSPPQLRGSWSATGAGQPLQGTWTAQPVPDRPDAAQGTWTLVAGGQTVTGGTWSATKNAGGWTGTWQARIVTRDNPQGRVLSGTWRADAASAPADGTLLDLLRRAAAAPVSGRWTSGGRSGAWSIRAQ